jgi:hypothetical protein
MPSQVSSPDAELPGAALRDGVFPELARDDVFRLETPRLWLRWPRQSDRPALLRAGKAAGDEAGACSLTRFAPPASRSDTDTLVLSARQANAAGAALILVVTRKGRDGEALGLVSLVPAAPGRLQAALWLAGPMADARDIAIESLQALVEAGLILCEADSVELDPGSAALACADRLERLGFRPASPLGSLRLSRDNWNEQPGPGHVPGEIARAAAVTAGRDGHCAQARARTMPPPCADSAAIRWSVDTIHP